MPSPPPIAYCFEGEPLRAADLPATLALPPGWRAQLPATLFEPGSERLRFVGVLAAGRGLLVALPKYLRARPAAEWAAPGASHAAEAARVLAVLHRYGRLAAAPLPNAAEVAEPTFFAGEPAVALALLEDYQAQGYWHEPQRELSTWPGARPDWPRTVARATPLLTDGGPLYPVRYGYRAPAAAAATLLEQLHRWAVRYCLTTYQAVLPGLAQLGYDPDAATDLAELGEPTHLHQVVEEARRRTFRDGRLQTLGLLAALLAGQAPAGADRPGALFGTTAFAQVWEAACRVAFADRSAALPLALPVASWHPLAGAVPVYQNPGNRLIPDVVWFSEKTLLVADAKYYTPVFQPTGQLAYNPGMPDLTKQLLYEQALLPGLRAAGYAQEVVHNAFILPASRPPAPVETMAQWQWGHAQTNIAGWQGRQVAIWLVPPALLFDAYLQGAPVAWVA
jgi:hypothetical protein